MKRLCSHVALAGLLLALPTALHLGRWSHHPIGVDAVSAVTPGYVAVVGIGTTSGPGAPASPTIEDLVRGAFYLSGGLHRAIDPSARQVLVRPGHTPMKAGALAQHLEVVRAIVLLLHDIAPEAQISLLVGGVPGSGVTAPEGLIAGLQALISTESFTSMGVHLLALEQEEVETIEVPDGGEVADLYPMPISLLECDAVINVARYQDGLSGLKNLRGLVAPPAGDVDEDHAGRLVDLALLVEVKYTVLDLLGDEHPLHPLILASDDGIAVDRLAGALAGIFPAPEALQRAGSRQLGMSTLRGIKATGLDAPGTWRPEPESEPQEE